MTKADRPELPEQKRTRPPEPFPGFTEPRTCANCQHFRKILHVLHEGSCRNGISGRLRTRPVDGCMPGFYPAIDRFPLRAGPGGVR